MQRSFSHTPTSLTRTRPSKASFDSMWRRSALLSRAAGLRLDAERREVEEQIAERRQQQHAESQPQHSQTCIADLRKQLRKPVAAEVAKHLGYFGEDASSNTHAAHAASWSNAPHHTVSRLVARTSGPGRLTAFLGFASGAEWYSATRASAFLASAEAADHALFTQATRLRLVAEYHSAPQHSLPF
ncbi:hypothetical protein [Hymenobacter latericus]|uniref:hypothetical protein n=1 Tax=Hymenobacter sp. YIM 151858-1 TaxID=2987688 RepID=UPI002226AF4B|nr:hypothetical protein [Hymenobacter sp. YIM 151858-1]UYZ57926.1 hypothetical protein OIS50_12760 [Hymenobacter sp. YIM 151858-1]